MRHIGLIAAAAMALMPMAAQAMTVELFLTKAKALQALGPLALASSDLPLVQGEIKAVATAYRAQVEADKAAGKPPRACPPPRGQAHLDPATILTEFDALPRAKKQGSVKTALFELMDRHYPCK